MPLNQNPETGRKLQRQYGFARIPSLNVAEELVPVAIVDNLPEVFPSEIRRPCRVSNGALSAVGNQSWVWLQARDLEVIIEGILIFSDTDSIVNLRVGPINQPSGSANTGDFQNRGISGPSNARSFGDTQPSGTVTGRIMDRFNIGAGERIQISMNEPIRLKPGGTVDNNAIMLQMQDPGLLRVSFEWIEFDIQA